MTGDPTSADADQPLRHRPGLRIVDWNAGRRPQGTRGNEIATTFSQVVGSDDDPAAARFVHVVMVPDSVPRLRHSHPGWTTTIVLAGSIDIEGETFTAGQMVVVAPNVVYGPLVPGPDGAVFIEIFGDENATAIDWDAPGATIDEYRQRGWIPPESPERGLRSPSGGGAHERQ